MCYIYWFFVEVGAMYVRISRPWQVEYKPSENNGNNLVILLEPASQKHSKGGTWLNMIPGWKGQIDVNHDSGKVELSKVMTCNEPTCPKCGWVCLVFRFFPDGDSLEWEKCDREQIGYFNLKEVRRRQRQVSHLRLVS